MKNVIEERVCVVVKARQGAGTCLRHGPCVYTVAGGSESKEGMKIGRRLRELYIGHRRTKKKGRRHIYMAAAILFAIHRLV